MAEPAVSWTLIVRPAARQISRCRRPCVRPPAFAILRPIPSAASSAIVWTIDASFVASSSKIIGTPVLRRSETHSRHVAQGASKTKSRPCGSNRSILRAVSTVMPQLASTRKNSPGFLSAKHAAIRSASSAGRFAITAGEFYSNIGAILIMQVM